MRTTELVTRLTEVLEPEAQARGLELVAVEQVGGRGTPVLRVLLDSEDGINLDAVAAASEWVSSAIDAETPFSQPYTLEVSSPGIDRPLIKRADFERFAGETVSVKSAGAQSRHSWTGTLVGLKGDDVVLMVDEAEVRVPFDDIQKARLKGVVDFGKGRGQQ